ncbi:hypothetical protein [Sphingomonas sp.]|uniref:hypothetical protein n=1 Tax=Sphingomonas sp. TaxID=28214 RepID=UPI001ED0F6FF|nr:hypothetical protein [Sphingomonas sp.]MBX3594629.1 hypothetical protein [Sphingomonas sp.]
MIASTVLIMQAVAAAFAPPLDTRITVRSEMRRTDNGVSRRFAASRTVVFTRREDGFRATVTLEAAEAEEPGDDPTAMFRAAFSRLAGRRVVFDLDRDGAVIAIADAAALWAALLDGIRSLAPTGGSATERGRAARIAAVVAALNALPDASRRSIIASLLTPLIATDVARGGAQSPQPVRVPAASAFGATQIDGVRSVRLAADTLEVRTAAEGPVRLRGPDGIVDGRIAVEMRRIVERGSGLVVRSEETVRTRTGTEGAAQERVTTTRLIF